jgi:hypothetical protein
LAKVNVRVSIAIDAPAAQVWRILGAFDGLPAISSATAVSRIEDGGRVRVLTGRSGGILWERMLQFDEAKRLLAYEITDAKACEGLAYGAGYRGTVRVLPGKAGRGAIFLYQASFQPSPGVGPREARAAVVAFAEDCAAGVRRVLRNQHS